jgi:mycothiol synthase
MTDNGTVRGLRSTDLPAVRAIMEASLHSDRIPGLTPSEIERRLVRLRAEADRAVVALDGEHVVGYCAPVVDDLTVHPGYRRRGHGRRMVGAIRDLLAAQDEKDLVLYVPAHLEPSVGFAEALGFRYRSSLWQFELAPDAPVAGPEFPPDVTTRHWRPDEDVDAWVRFVTAAFEGHPTPVHLSPEIVRRVHAEPRFDPGSICILAARQDAETPIGFARVELLQDPGALPTGYVNMIGVLPAWRGRGLGRELLRWSVAYLRAQGTPRIQLAVEAANERATQLYRRHGFEPDIEWPHWALPTT